MPKPQSGKANGNVFKTIVRTVVREELVQVEKRLDKKLDMRFGVMKDDLLDKMNELFSRYRDETVSKLDQIIGMFKKKEEEDIMHAGQHADIHDRLEKLETIHPHGKHD